MYVFLPEGIVRVWGGLVLDVAGIQAFFSGQTFPKKKKKIISPPCFGCLFSYLGLYEVYSFFF